MRVGIISRREDTWHTNELSRELKKRGAEPFLFDFPDMVARVGFSPSVSARGIDLLSDVASIIVRPIGRGSLEEIIFSMDMLLTLSRRGLPIVNEPRAIEKCVDKYYALVTLEEYGLPVPRTVVCRGVREALQAFEELGGDVVVKPIFGSRGVGVARVSDREVAWRVFSALAFNRMVLYVQEFVEHGNRDIRALVLNGEVISSMYRVGGSWKTNIAQGARPVAIRLPEDLQELAVKACEVIGCKLAGVDMIEARDGRVLIVEVNSQPGWEGLQRVTSFSIAGRIAEYLIKVGRR